MSRSSGRQAVIYVNRTVKNWWRKCVLVCCRHILPNKTRFRSRYTYGTTLLAATSRCCGCVLHSTHGVQALAFLEHLTIMSNGVRDGRGLAGSVTYMPWYGTAVMRSCGCCKVEQSARMSMMSIDKVPLLLTVCVPGWCPPKTGGMLYCLLRWWLWWVTVCRQAGRLCLGRQASEALMRSFPRLYGENSQGVARDASRCTNRCV